LRNFYVITSTKNLYQSELSQYSILKTFNINIDIKLMIHKY